MSEQEPDLHTRVATKAREIETELRSLHRWQQEPLPPERFENMGAFGSNTMTFDQWLQFILIPRIDEIVNERGDFPSGSMVGTYAIREFDGDPEGGTLQQLLYELDDLINGEPPETYEVIETSSQPSPPPESVTLGDTTIPEVLFTIAGILPQFEGDDLESQLQTFDIFLNILSPTVRPAISDLLLQAAQQTANPTSRKRIERAANAVRLGNAAAKPL